MHTITQVSRVFGWTSRPGRKLFIYHTISPESLMAIRLTQSVPSLPPAPHSHSCPSTRPPVYSNHHRSASYHNFSNSHPCPCHPSQGVQVSTAKAFSRKE